MCVQLRLGRLDQGYLYFRGLADWLMYPILTSAVDDVTGYAQPAQVEMSKKSTFSNFLQLPCAYRACLADSKYVIGVFLAFWVQKL